MSTDTTATPATPAPAKTRGSTKRKAYENTSYVYKLVKDVDPTTTISADGMRVLLDVFDDLHAHLAEEAERIKQSAGRKTVTNKDVRLAARTILNSALYAEVRDRAAVAEVSYTQSFIKQ